MVFAMFGFFSSMVLLALFTQKVLGYDAWTSGLVLAPGGVGNLLSLLVAGRLINRMDQRLLLAVGCLLNAYAAWSMSVLTVGVDYWGLAWPRFVQGLGVGLIFVPLNAVGLATIPRASMGNATALLNVVRNLGGGMGVAVVSTLLSRRAQEHQSTLIATSTSSTPRRWRACPPGPITSAGAAPIPLPPSGGRWRPSTRR
jgi:DHA2 family multidrug resistance protein